VTDVRTSRVGLEVVAGGTPDLRVSRVMLEVVAPYVAALPVQDWIVQVDWPDLTADGAFPWEPADNPLINFLTGHTVSGREVACLRGVDYTRRTFHAWRPQLSQDTCTVTFFDRDGAMWPGKSTSLLSPNVELGRPARVLAVWAGTVYQQFYGTIREIVPPPQSPPYEGSITIESPLRALAELVVTPSAQESPTVVAALEDLFAVAGLDAAYYDIDSAEITAAVDGAWGGAETTFGSALRELILMGDLLVSCEPLYRVNVGGADYQVRVWHPDRDRAAAAYATWISTDGDLNAPQDVTYYGPEAVPADSALAPATVAA
jgi:hypothetical protein